MTVATPSLVNPLTTEICLSEPELLQSTINSYQKIKTQQFQLAQEEKVLIDLWEQLAQNRGNVKTLDGKQQQVVLNPRTNVSYPRDRGDEHPLRKLLRMYDAELLPLLKIDYAESGSKVETLLEDLEAGKLRGTLQELAEKLKLFRLAKPGKPEIKIKELGAG